MPRSDTSEYLIHFTRDDTIERAFSRLHLIIHDKRLLGGAGFIRGGFKCVCFSEAPLSDLESGLVNPDYYSKYSPFGIMVSKKWLYAQGGRPVIYEHDNEYDALPDSHKWRHVRYEPGSEPPVDFTWEREWRIRTNALDFDSSTAAIVVEKHSWAARLIHDHALLQESEIRQYSIILDEELARMMFEEPFRWRIITLR